MNCPYSIRLDLSRPTVRRAIVELVARGLLVRRRGIRTTVAQEVIHRRNELTSLYDGKSNGEGRTPLTEILQLVTDYVDQRPSQILGLPKETPLVYIERLRSVPEGPMAILKNWLAPSFADVTRRPQRGGPVRAAALPRPRPRWTHQTIRARPAVAEGAACRSWTRMTRC